MTEDRGQMTEGGGRIAVWNLVSVIWSFRQASLTAVARFSARSFLIS